MRAMKDVDYLSMSTYVRVQEKRLMDTAGMERAADAPSIAEALRMIGQNGDYDFGALRRPEDYESAVRAELARVYKMAYKTAERIPALPEILGCKYDFHNVKVALKAKFCPQAGALPYVKATPVSPELIEKTVQKYDPKANLSANLLEAIVAGEQAYAVSENPQDIDLAVDKRMYAHMSELAGVVGSDFVAGYVRRAIDFYNVKTLMRVKNMQKGSAFLAECIARGGDTDPSLLLAAYGKNAGALSLAFAFKNYGDAFKAGLESYERSGNYSELERLLDNELIRYVQNAKRVSFGPEILFAYLVSKENEIKQVRIVAACKLNGIATAALKERLRENYV